MHVRVDQSGQQRAASEVDRARIVDARRVVQDIDDAIALDSVGRVYTANLASNDVTRITQSYDCVDIEGATGSSYTQTAADVG